MSKILSEVHHEFDGAVHGVSGNKGPVLGSEFCWLAQIQQDTLQRCARIPDEAAAEGLGQRDRHSGTSSSLVLTADAA